MATEQLSKDKLIEGIIRKNSVSKKIDRISINKDKVPLSFAQNRLWILQQIEPESIAYNMVVSMEIKGDLDQKAFEMAIGELVFRQEALRIKMGSENGIPYQYLTDDKVDYKYEDLSSLFIQDVDKTVSDIIERANRPFNLEKDNLCKFRLIKVSEEKFVFVLLMHHIISDGQSIKLIKQDLFTYYKAFKTHMEIPSYNPMSTQYLDYAYWQSGLKESGEFKRQYDYWIDQLRNHTYVLPLPYDYKRPSKKTENGFSIHFSIPEKVAAELKELAQQNQSTLFMIMFTTFSILLKKYSGESDVLIGTPISNRQQSDLESVIGFFVNTLVLRSNTEGSSTFLQHLKNDRNMILDAFENQDVPIDLLVDDLMKTRNTIYSPLFQVMFSLENQQESIHTELDGLQFIEKQFNSVKTSKFDLSLDLEEGSNGITGTFECNSDLFKPITIERLIKNYTQLLNSIVKNPNEQVNRLNLVSEDEIKTVLHDWNQTHMKFPKDKCVHQLFEEAVERYPLNPAVVFEDETLTYQELNHKANQLAHYLITKGVGPDKSVAIGMERSLELPIALLAVLKAGASFVPLDLDAPQERNKQMIIDSDSKLCLINNEYLPIPKDVVPLVKVGDIWEFEQFPKTSPDSKVTPDDLVSIYFTSGTTGKPKGVSVYHKGWVNRVQWMQHKFQLKQDETVLQKTTLTFDDVALEYFWTFMAGGRVAIIKPGAHRDPYEIINAIAKYQPSVVFFVPSMLKLVTERITKENIQSFSSLREVLSGGEALKPGLVELFFNKLEACNLHNSYGVTEVSVDSTLHTCTMNDSKYRVPVGKPIGNNFVYVLDENRNPVPIGVKGFLYLGGDGVARDYYKNPEKTAEAFFDNPFLPSKNERIYKTGDLAFYDQDGNLFVTGRVDNQLKIRGIRIELDEIATVLSKHPQVKECAVIVENDENDDEPKLMAFVVINEEIKVTQTALRQFCRKLLPQHMIPYEFIKINNIPLNSNGKVDRKALSSLQREKLTDEKDSHPTTYIEYEVLDVWNDVLGIDSENINNNFFDVGGHSIKAVILMDRLNQLFKSRISVATLFEHSTVKELAAFIENGTNSTKDNIKLLKSSKNTNNPLILIPPAGGGLLGYSNLIRNLKDINIYGIVPKGFESNESPVDNMEEIAVYYFGKVKEIQEKGPYKLAGWSLGGNIAFEVARLIEQEGEEVALLFLIDSSPPSSEPISKKITQEELVLEWTRDKGIKEKLYPKFDDLLIACSEFMPDYNPDFSRESTLNHIKVRLANNIVHANYRSDHVINADIHFIHATEKNPDSMDPPTDPTTWRDKTKGQFYYHAGAGNHDSILDKENVNHTSNYINQYLVSDSIIELVEVNTFYPFEEKACKGTCVKCKCLPR